MNRPIQYDTLTNLELEREVPQTQLVNVAINSIPTAKIGNNLTPDVNAWFAAAACLGIDHNLFFPAPNERPTKKEEREAIAKKICEGCPVVKQCLEFALLHQEYGFWGGMSEDERQIQFGIKPTDARFSPKLSS